MNIMLIYGGQTPEHDVSVLSAKHAAGHLNGSVIPVAVTRKGQWYLQDQVTANIDTSREVTAVPGRGFFTSGSLISCDAVFPLIHGNFGEDGGIQGLLSSIPLPSVSCSIESSSIGMSKHLTKLLCRSIGIPVTPGILLRRDETPPKEDEITFPVYVKPDRCGSSIGVSRVRWYGQLQDSISKAFRYDNRILIEQEISGFEMQSAWTASSKGVKFSCIGEIHTPRGIHSYRSKYFSGSQAYHVIPSNTDASVQKRIFTYAGELLGALDYPLYGRIDFLYSPADDRVVFNEINTVPGMTPMSMFPSLWEHSGRSFSSILDDIITHAVELHAKSSSIIRSYHPGEEDES